MIQSSWRRWQPAELYRRVWKSAVCFLADVGYGQEIGSGKDIFLLIFTSMRFLGSMLDDLCLGCMINLEAWVGGGGKMVSAGINGVEEPGRLHRPLSIFTPGWTCIWSRGVRFFGFDWTSSKMVLGFRIAGAGLGSGTAMGGKEVITVAGLSLMMTREGTGAWLSTLGLPRETHGEVVNNLDWNRKVIGSIANHICVV